MKKYNTRLKRFIKNVIKIMRKPVMSILPGQMSFFLLLSLIPMALLIGVLSSKLSISISSLSSFVKNSLPPNTSKLILPLLKGKGFDYNIIILVISALLLASKGSRSIITAASTIYKTDDNEPIKDTVKSFIITILLIILIAFIVIIPVFGSRILNLLLNISHTKFINEGLIDIYNILKWPTTFFMIFFNLKIIYTIAPNKQINSSTVTKGSMFTTVLWVISTWLYSFYITHLTKYNIFYGSASSIIILMLWIYLISYIFVLGMSLNASSDKIDNV